MGKPFLANRGHKCNRMGIDEWAERAEVHGGVSNMIPYIPSFQN